MSSESTDTTPDTTLDPTREAVDQIFAGLGIPRVAVFDAVEQRVSEFLAERGYREHQVWFEGYRFGVVKIGVTPAWAGPLLWDAEDLREILGELDPDVEVKVVRRRERRREAA